MVSTRQRTVQAAVLGTVVAGMAGCPSEDRDAGDDETDDSASDGSGDSSGSDSGGSPDLGMGPSSCVLDLFDPNDTAQTAKMLFSPTTQVDATLCTGADEVDWWKFTLADESYVGVEAHFESDGLDVSLELRNAATNALVHSSSGGTDIQAVHGLLAPGSYQVAVRRTQGDPAYTLETYALSTRTDPAVGERATRVFCPRFDLDDDYTDASNLADNREDFGLDDFPADRWVPQGLLVRVTNGQDDDLLGWGPLGADGCTPEVITASPSDTDFVVEFALWSHIRRDVLPDTFVIHYDCEQGQRCELPIRSVDWTTPTGSFVADTQVIATGDEGVEFSEEVLIHWAASFAESRATMGLLVRTSLYSTSLGAANIGSDLAPVYIPCSGPGAYCPHGGGCQDPDPLGFFHCRPKTRTNLHIGGHPTLDIAADTPGGKGAPREKFTIAHEFGHVQTLLVPLGSAYSQSQINLQWCSQTSTGGTNHTLDSSEWQSAALVEGAANFYATVVFNAVEPGAWFQSEDVENDTSRFQANCPGDLAGQVMMGLCVQPGDAMSCMAGGANEIDWAGTLWDFLPVVGEAELPGVLLLVSDAFAQANWDPGSPTPDAYTNISTAVGVRFPGNQGDFDAAAQINGTNQ